VIAKKKFYIIGLLMITMVTLYGCSNTKETDNEITTEEETWEYIDDGNMDGVNLFAREASGYSYVSETRNNGMDKTTWEWKNDEHNTTVSLVKEHMESTFVVQNQDKTYSYPCLEVQESKETDTRMTQADLTGDGIDELIIRYTRGMSTGMARFALIVVDGATYDELKVFDGAGFTAKQAERINAIVDIWRNENSEAYTWWHNIYGNSEIEMGKFIPKVEQFEEGNKITVDFVMYIEGYASESFKAKLNYTKGTFQIEQLLHSDKIDRIMVN
jgi:hypothetical protein